MVSTRDLGGLPDLATTLRLVRSLAALDAVMSPQWEYRYYMFDSAWGEGEAMASMRDGCGDQWNAVFCAHGAALVGLAHESASYVPGQPHPAIFADLPEAFVDNLLHEPAFETSNATLCIWRERGDAQWQSGASAGQPLPTDDGSEVLLSILSGDPQRYVDYAAAYFEREVALDDVAVLYAHQPPSDALIRRLNPEADPDGVRAELEQIGYGLG